MKKTFLTLATLASLAACKQTPTEIPQGNTPVKLHWNDANGSCNDELKSVLNEQFNLITFQRQGFEMRVKFAGNIINCEEMKSGKIGCLSVDAGGSQLVAVDGTEYQAQIIHSGCTYVAKGNAVD